MWFNLAAVQGNKLHADFVDRIAQADDAVQTYRLPRNKRVYV